MKRNIKIRWYLRNILNLMIACVRIAIHCLVHPRRFRQLGFSIFSTLNEFYQWTHGELLPFEDTKTYQMMKDRQIYARSNYFNTDPKVMRPVETQVMSALTAFLQPKVVLEIGTYNGSTAYHFALNSPEEAKIYTLDLPPGYGQGVDAQSRLAGYSYDDYLVVKLSQENINKRVFKGKPEEGKIQELFGDSKTFDFSPFYGKVDLIFIDGSHAYEYVKSDTEQAMKMLSTRGVVVWHDFDYIIHRDVFKYLNQLAKIHKVYSIANTRFAVFGRAL